MGISVASYLFLLCSNVYIEDKHPMVVIKTREFWTLWFMFLTNGQAVQFSAALYKVSTLKHRLYYTLHFGTIFMLARNTYLQRPSTDKYGTGASFIRAVPKIKCSVNGVLMNL